LRGELQFFTIFGEKEPVPSNDIDIQ